ncbi:hypothetical protein D8S78_13835 [Natrialba swarupiae]|nr:hypothetical protein [Natrialba swarupiae]
MTTWSVPRARRPPRRSPFRRRYRCCRLSGIRPSRRRRIRSPSLRFAVLGQTACQSERDPTTDATENRSSSHYSVVPLSVHNGCDPFVSRRMGGRKRLEHGGQTKPVRRDGVRPDHRPTVSRAASRSAS